MPYGGSSNENLNTYMIEHRHGPKIIYKKGNEIKISNLEITFIYIVPTNIWKGYNNMEKCE